VTTPHVSFDFEETFGEDYLYFYVPLLSAERTRKEVERIVEFFGFASESPEVLDVPCGHGRHSNLLAARGFRVTGLDATAVFLEHARTEASALGVDVTYVQGDMRSLPWAESSFDGLLCWFTSFGYFDDADNKKVLAEFRRVLRPGGKLVLETHHHDAFVRAVSPGSASVERVNDDYLINQVAFDPLSGRIETDRLMVRDGKVHRTHLSVRLLTVPEFRAWLEEAGFAEITVTSNRGRPVTLDVARIVIVAA
jgi:ubiquinone/menaquinone biosynthesis C-methylase UbiE